MRGLASYLLVGLLGAVVMELITASAGFDRAVGARTAETAAAVQVVNRARKADRLPVPSIGRNRTPAPPVLAGCDPVFSTLSAAARLNTAGRCLA